MSVNHFTPQQKASMALEHIQNKVSLSAIQTKYGVSSSYLSKLISVFQKDAYKVFEKKEENGSEVLLKELEQTKIALAESQTALSVLKKKSGL